MIMAVFLALVLAGDDGAQSPADCLPIEKEINGKSLEGQLFPGQKISVLPSSCRAPARMDFVIFTSSENENLVIKQIWGVPGDILSVGERGQVLVNGEQTLTPFDKPYILDRFHARRLRKFEGPLKGYLALGHPGSLDSGRLGPIHHDDIIGVVDQEVGRARH